MGCNCGGKPKPKPEGNGLTQEFSLQMPDGHTETFGSRLEADAEYARQRNRQTV